MRAVAVVGLITAVGVGAHFLWRYSYYGEWMPNTAKVKAGFSGLPATPTPIIPMRPSSIATHL